MDLCVPMATRYMQKFGWGYVDKIDDKMRSDLEDAICNAIEY
jgi:hypothetical protein